jgi:hypothetical protein
MAYKIYAVEGDLDHLVLLDGLWVVNGHYECKRDGADAVTCGSSHSGTGRPVRAYFVMNAPRGTDYNDVIEKAREIIRRQLACDSNPSASSGTA